MCTYPPMSVGEQFYVCSLTSQTVTTEFVHSLYRHYNEFIYFPQSKEETKNAIKQFEKLGTGFLQTEAATDGTNDQTYLRWK